jgi:hypothetical protein
MLVSTISGNCAIHGGGISGSATLQNTIVAHNSSGGNRNGAITSKGSNLSSDNTCNFRRLGDLNNTDPLLGTFAYNGGPTQTIPLSREVRRSTQATRAAAPMPKAIC